MDPIDLFGAQGRSPFGTPGPERECNTLQNKSFGPSDNQRLLEAPPGLPSNVTTIPQTFRPPEPSNVPHVHSTAQPVNPRQSGVMTQGQVETIRRALSGAPVEQLGVEDLRQTVVGLLQVINSGSLAGYLAGNPQIGTCPVPMAPPPGVATSSVTPVLGAASSAPPPQQVLPPGLPQLPLQALQSASGSQAIGHYGLASGAPDGDDLGFLESSSDSDTFHPSPPQVGAQKFAAHTLR